MSSINFQIDDENADCTVEDSLGKNLTTMEQMDNDSVPKSTGVSNVTSALDPIPKSLDAIPGSCEAIAGTTSFASNDTRGKYLQENMHLGAPYSGLEDDNSNDIHVTDSKASAGCKNLEDNVFPSESTIVNTTADDMKDVKVCDICGNVGYEEMLVICSDCNEGAEHIYCMQTLLYGVPEGDWFCDSCKLKYKERDQRKTVIDSPRLFSFSQGTEKQVGNENSALKISSSSKLKLSSDKMQMQKSAHKSVVLCKQQRGDSNEARANKKQMIECDNVRVNTSQLLFHRNSSCKSQATIRADSCGGLPQIKIPVVPYTRDGSLKISEAGKFDSCAMASLANKNSIPRSFSRENSFKAAETAKVKFLPTHTVASLCSGMALRESSKFTDVDGLSDAASSQTSATDSRQVSSRGSSIPMTGSASPLSNKPGLRSSFRPSSAYSCLQSARLSKSEDAFPSFLLSSRLNTHRGHSNLGSSKEAINGNGQLGLTGNSSGTLGNTRSNSSRSCVPVSSNYSKDYKIIAPGTDEVNGILKHSSGTFAFSSTMVEKSVADISSQPGLDSRSSKPDALTLTKGNSHLRPLSAEKCSAVLTEVLQPPKMICEELKGYAMAKESREGLILTKRAVEGLVFIEHPNVLDSDKEDLGGMKPMKGIINTSKLTHKKIGIQLAASVMVEDDRVLMPSVVSRGTKLLEEDKAVSDVRKDRLPMVESSLSIKEPEMLTLSKEDCKCPDPPAPEDKVTVTVTVREDTKLSLSNKKVAPGSLDKQTDEKGTLQTSTNLSLHKDRVNDLSSTLHDNTSAFRFKSTPVSLMNDSNPVEASQASAALLQTKQNIFAEMVLGRNDGKMEIKSTSNVIVRGSSDSSTCISTEANAKPTNGNYNDPFILGGILDKDFLPTSIPHKFGREVLMATQSYKSTIQPSEINVSSSELVQTPVHSPSKNYAMGVPLQGMFGFSWQKLSSWPESLFLWRGSFKIIDKITGHHIFDGMQAHPSNKASPKVYEVSRKFPSQLLLEQVQRCDAWPKRFQESPPTDEDIALYILPVEIESCKIQYFELLEATIKQDLTLRVYLECAELLIFSSNQLPESYHRYNGQMYLWGVFRGGKKTHLDDPQRQFPGYDNDGSNVVQPTPSSLLMKNNNSLPRQLTSFNTSGCSEGEEDMDVDMEGGREIGMAETPAPRPQSQPANVIESITMKTSVLSNSKPMLSHHENFKSGSCMPFKQAGISSVASWSDSVKIFRKITKRKEGIDVDIEGVREIEMAERPKSRSESQLENLTENSATRTPVLSNSKPILSRHDNSKSGRCIPFEQGLSSIAPSSGSAKILGKIPQYILSNSNAKDAERRNGQPSTYDANNELDFPPGFELPPVFHHSSAISRNNSGKHMEAMLENMNRFGVKLQGRELPPRLGFPNDKMESSDKNMAFGFSSQGCNCPPGTVLESEEFPPGFNPASLKSPVSSPDCPPGLELASMKSLVSPPDCPPGLESTFMKTLTTHPVCPPAYMKPLVSSAECPPLIEVASVKCLVNSLDASRCLELTSIKPLVSSPDWPPGLEPACIKPLLSSPECPPGLEITSMMPLISSAECSAALEVASVTCPDCPPSLEPSVGNSRFSLPFSHDTDPANGMLNPFSSECPPGFESALGNCPLTSLDHPPRFESASGKSLFPSSGPLENMTCKPLQDKPDLEVQIKMEPVCQRSPHLSSGKDYSSRNHATIYHTNGSRRVMHSHSFTSITREADKGRNAAKMSKNKSFKEEFYYNRNRREKEDTREGGRNCREKECNRKGIGSSNREKEGRREWFRNYSSEKEGRRERYRNSSREKEGKKEGGRKHSGEKQDTRNREGKNTERENRRDRDRGYHRHRSRYIGMRRLKDHEKHAHNLSRCSHPVSATPSYSALGGKCRIDAIGKMVSIHHASSSFSESNIENHSYDRPSLEKDSENGEKAVTVNLHKGKAIMDNDFVLRSEHCSLESEEKFCTEAGRILTDNNHILLCDLNDEATYDCEIIDQKNLSGTASQEHTQLNISDTMISRKEYDFLLSEQVEQDVIPVESNWSSGSMMTTHDSVKCLQLFPIWGNCGGSESFVSDRNFSLELGIGQRTASKEPLPLLEQSSLQSLSCNFLLDNGCGISRSRSVCDDSGEVSPTEASILSLSMPRYRREGNSWVEITKDTELSEEVDADLKLTLSMA